MMLMKRMLVSQVVPSLGEIRWMSARSNPACAILPSGRLVVVGGEKYPATPFRLDKILTFTIKHCCAPANLAKFLAPGTEVFMESCAYGTVDTG